MEKLDQTIVNNLLQVEQAPAVTVYIPMHTSASPPHVSGNQIRLKNLLQTAIEHLQQAHDTTALADELQATIKQLSNDMKFWETQTPGMLLCATPGSVRLFHLPIDTEEYVAVDSHFHLAPVLGLLHDHHDFYVLAVAQHQPRLCKGTLYGLEEAGVDLPANVHDALNIDESNQKSENQGTRTGPSSKGMASGVESGRGWFNGRGGSRNPEEADRIRFFRLVDSVVTKHTDHSLPLVLAGVESELAEYRSISKYSKILEGSIAGNQSGTNHHRELYDKAQHIVHAELVMPAHRSVIEEYLRVGGTHPDRVAKDDKTISQAATEGRIDKFLASMVHLTADTIRDTADEVLSITFPERAKSKRLNDVAKQVWQTSGTIVSLQPEEMPQGLDMAARLRY